MARVIFTPQLRRYVDCPPVDVLGTTLNEVLDAVFVTNQRLRGYVLDEQGAIRKHVLVVINGEQIHDREQLTDPVPENSEVYILQALSGG